MRTGKADLDIRRSAGVAGVRCRVELGSPVNQVLALVRIPECLWSPDHTSSLVLDLDKPLIRPVDQVGALPYEDAPRARPLCRVPCRLCLGQHQLHTLNSIMRPQ